MTVQGLSHLGGRASFEHAALRGAQRGAGERSAPGGALALVERGALPLLDIGPVARGQSRKGEEWHVRFLPPRLYNGRRTRIGGKAMAEPVVYRLPEIKEKFGTCFTCGSLLTLDARQIPKKHWPLIPYAVFWGVADDWARETWAPKAPNDVKQNLRTIVAAYDDNLDEWLAGDEARSPNSSLEYQRFRQCEWRQNS